MTIYKVMEILDADGKGTGHFKNTREMPPPYQPKFAFCNHVHETTKEAERCLDFGRSE